MLLQIHETLYNLETHFLLHMLATFVILIDITMANFNEPQQQDYDQHYLPDGFIFNKIAPSPEQKSPASYQAMGFIAFAE